MQCGIDTVEGANVYAVLEGLKTGHAVRFDTVEGAKTVLAVRIDTVEGARRYSTCSAKPLTFRCQR